jgi:hypothetical protein
LGLPDFYKEKKPESFFNIFVKSLLIALGVALLAFGLKIFFSWLAFEKTSKPEIFQKLRESKEQEKLLAAQEWLRQLLAGNKAWTPSPTESLYLISELEAAAERLQYENPVKFASLVGVLGFSEDKDTMRARLVEVLDKVKIEAPENFVQAQILGLLSLARMAPLKGDGEEAYFASAAKSPDSSLRKAFAFASGLLLEGSDPFAEQVKETLRELLRDESLEVRWNAAFSLARVRDPAAIGPIDALLDEAARVGSEGGEALTQAKLDLFTETFRAAINLGEMKLRDKVSRISQEHPHLKLRQAAKNFVEK